MVDVPLPYRISTASKVWIGMVPRVTLVSAASLERFCLGRNESASPVSSREGDPISLKSVMEEVVKASYSTESFTGRPPQRHSVRSCCVDQLELREL